MISSLPLLSATTKMKDGRVAAVGRGSSRFLDAKGGVGTVLQHYSIYEQ